MGSNEDMWAELERIDPTGTEQKLQAIQNRFGVTREEAKRMVEQKTDKQVESQQTWGIVLVVVGVFCLIVIIAALT